MHTNQALVEAAKPFTFTNHSKHFKVVGMSGVVLKAKPRFVTQPKQGFQFVW